MVKKETPSQHTAESKSALKLTEGVDFTYNENGLMVLSREYHLKRGYCCKSGCKNCPYDFSKSFDSDIPLELQLAHHAGEDEDWEGLAEEYLKGHEED